MERDTNWRPQDPFPYWPNSSRNGNDHQQPPQDNPPLRRETPSDSDMYKTPPRREPSFEEEERPSPFDWQPARRFTPPVEQVVPRYTNDPEESPMRPLTWHRRAPTVDDIEDRNRPHWSPNPDVDYTCPTDYLTHSQMESIDGVLLNPDAPPVWPPPRSPYMGPFKLPFEEELDWRDTLDLGTRETPDPEVPRESTPAQEGPRQTGRVRQERQQPDNVYGGANDECQTDLRRKLFWSIIPQSSQNDSRDRDVGASYHSYNSCKSVSVRLLNMKEALDLIIEEGGEGLQNFFLSAVKRYTPPPNKGETKLPNPIYICEWTYKDILCFPGKLKEEWRQACLNELSALKERQV